MKNKIVIFSLLLSSISLSNVRDYRPNYDKIDKYKGFKQAAGILGDFNYITPSFTYNRNSSLPSSTNQNIISGSITLGPITYSKGETHHSIEVRKNISEIIDTKMIVTYYSKIQEFYNLRDKKTNEYKMIVDKYFDYILLNLELQYNLVLADNLKNNINVLNSKLKLGKISEFDYENASLKLEIIKNKIENLKINIEEMTLELKRYNIDIDKINIDDINIYKVKEIDIKKYVEYVNSKAENENKLKKFTNLKNKIDVFLPDINVFYKYDIKNNKNDYGVTISKTIPIADSLYVDNKLSEDNIMKRKISIDEEMKKYTMLKRAIELSEKQLELSHKELKINNLKLELGKIDINEYLKKVEEHNSKEIDLIKSKIKFTKYILERER